MNRLAPSAEGDVAAAVYERALVVFDAVGARLSETALSGRATSIARFGDEWLVRLEDTSYLTRTRAGTTPAPQPLIAPTKPKRVAKTSAKKKTASKAPADAFAAGKATIDAFTVGRDDSVVVVRGEAIELWSRDAERRWLAMATCPILSATISREHVVALGEDGALYFFGGDTGDALGALRLASPDPTDTFRLAFVDGNVVVLALGEWLVWVDSSTRKTVRRVRARAKVLELAADGAHVVAAVDDGGVQAFRASTGEPRAAFNPYEGQLVGAVALGPTVVMTLPSDGAALHVVDRQSLDTEVRAASPVSALSARADLVVAADRSGGVRLFDADELLSGPPSGTVAGKLVGPKSPEAVVGVHVSKSRAIVTASVRMVMHLAPPYDAPRPIMLKSSPTAFAADDAYAFVGTQAGAVDVYDLEAARHVTSYALSSDDRISAMTRLPGAMLVVGTGALDGRVLIVDVANAEVVHRMSPHEEAFGVTALASDSRGRIVASGSDDGSIALLDPQKGRLLARIRVSETVTSMAFEPLGRRLACVFADGTARIVTLASSGATVSDLGVRGASHVAWGDGLVFGFKDGRVESGDRHARPSERPRSQLS